MRITYILIALCVLVFALERVAPDAVLPEVTLSPIGLLAAPWTLVTSMFAHGSLEHLLFNMLALFMFGTVLEDRVGSAKFLFLYMVSGIVGSIGFMLFSSPFGLALGASGAIFGVMGALVLLEPHLLVYFYGIPIPMYVAGPVYALIELFGMGRVDSIAHSAHLLGFFGGLAIALTVRKESWPPRPQMEMWKALAAPLALALIVAIAFGAYYVSDPLNASMLSCLGKDDAAVARTCLLALAKEYKNSPQQQAYVCAEYAQYFDDGACGSV